MNVCRLQTRTAGGKFEFVYYGYKSLATAVVVPVQELYAACEYMYMIIADADCLLGEIV